MGKIVKYMDHKIGWTARINNAVAYTYGDMFLFGEEHIPFCAANHRQC
jgi:hypothetical protein